MEVYQEVELDDLAYLSDLAAVNIVHDLRVRPRDVQVDASSLDIRIMKTFDMKIVSILLLLSYYYDTWEKDVEGEEMKR